VRENGSVGLALARRQREPQFQVFGADQVRAFDTNRAAEDAFAVQRGKSLGHPHAARPPHGFYGGNAIVVDPAQAGKDARSRRSTARRYLDFLNPKIDSRMAC